jgi:hypothetical protein
LRCSSGCSPTITASVFHLDDLVKWSVLRNHSSWWPQYWFIESMPTIVFDDWCIALSIVLDGP